MIKTVKWKDHPSLGNLELNFCKYDGTPYNTIILAGENGTGKTTILETLSEFLTLGSIRNFEYIRYDVNNENYLAKPSTVYDIPGYHVRIKEIDGKKDIDFNRKNTFVNFNNNLKRAYCLGKNFWNKRIYYRDKKRYYFF